MVVFDRNIERKYLNHQALNTLILEFWLVCFFKPSSQPTIIVMGMNSHSPLSGYYHLSHREKKTDWRNELCFMVSVNRICIPFLLWIKASFCLYHNENFNCKPWFSVFAIIEDKVITVKVIYIYIKFLYKISVSMFCVKDGSIQKLFLQKNYFPDN